MAPLPLLKLGGLALKSLAKPVAKRLKYEAAQRPNVYQYCVFVGQWTHKAVAWINIASAGHKNMGIKELETSAAFNRGADFLSETFIFAVGGGVIVFEYSRSKMKEAQQARLKAEQWTAFTENLDNRLASIENRLTKLEAYKHSSEKRWFARLLPGEEDKQTEQGVAIKKATAPTTTSTTTTATVAIDPVKVGNGNEEKIPPVVEVLPPPDVTPDITSSPSPPPSTPPSGMTPSPSSSSSTLSWLWRSTWGYLTGKKAEEKVVSVSDSSSSSSTSPSSDSAGVAPPALEIGPTKVVSGSGSKSVGPAAGTAATK